MRRVRNCTSFPSQLNQLAQPPTLVPEAMGEAAGTANRAEPNWYAMPLLEGAYDTYEYDEIESVVHKFYYVRTNQDPTLLELGITAEGGKKVVSFDRKSFHGEWSMNEDYEYTIAFNCNPKLKPKRHPTFKPIANKGKAERVWRSMHEDPAWTVFLITIEGDEKSGWPQPRTSGWDREDRRVIDERHPRALER